VVRTEADVEVESYRQDDMYPQQELTEIWISIYYRWKVVLHIAA
jgi:predicted transcriptional regulator YdeE